MKALFRKAVKRLTITVTKLQISTAWVEVLVIVLTISNFLYKAEDWQMFQKCCWAADVKIDGAKFRVIHAELKASAQRYSPSNMTELGPFFKEE